MSLGIIATISLVVLPLGRCLLFPSFTRTSISRSLAPLPCSTGSGVSVCLIVLGLRRACQQPVPRAYLTLAVVALLAAPVAWVRYTSWALPFVIGPIVYLRASGGRVWWDLRAVSLALLAFLPLHELFWTQRLPDLVVSLPWWQTGRLGLLVVAVAAPRHSHFGPREHTMQSPVWKPTRLAA